LQRVLTPFVRDRRAGISNTGRIGAVAANPRAGQLAQPEDLADLPHLVTAFYPNVPDPDNAGQQVAFGTSSQPRKSW
jgi:phosphoglucomutase